MSQNHLVHVFPMFFHRFWSLGDHLGDLGRSFGDHLGTILVTLEGPGEVKVHRGIPKRSQKSHFVNFGQTVLFAMSIFSEKNLGENAWSIFVCVFGVICSSKSLSKRRGAH